MRRVAKKYITLFKLLIAEMVCIPITDIINNEIICKVIKKRLAYYKLPSFSEYAILAIFYLSKGNVGHAILILTDILEKYDTLKPEKITASFIFEFVFPKGLSEEQLQVLYNEKSRNHEKYKYSFLFQSKPEVFVLH